MITRIRRGLLAVLGLGYAPLARAADADPLDEAFEGWSGSARLESWLSGLGVPDSWTTFVAGGIWLVVIVSLAGVAQWGTQRLLVLGLDRIASKTRTVWDDFLIRRRVFAKLGRIAPVLVVYLLVPLAFTEHVRVVAYTRLVAELFMLAILISVLFSLLDAAHDVYGQYDLSKRVPIKGAVQAVKLIAFIIVALVMLSVVTSKNPAYFLGGIGAMTAVLLLIFKDPILGLVAGIQLATNDMVRPGDWIEMPQFGANGDVTDVSLTTVKVQNWDKTISTIPTYALVSGSFKNWRGMTEGEGRRIKRSISIDLASVRFLDDELLAHLSKIQILKDYLDRKTAEVRSFNEERGVDPDSQANGRRLTNLGTFRAYVDAYLRANPAIHRDMTFLVRQLEPTPEGVPIEIYVFSSDKNWANYEAIQSDIFDHLLAVVPEFGLRVYQRPAGADVREVLAAAKG